MYEEITFLRQPGGPPGAGVIVGASIGAARGGGGYSIRDGVISFDAASDAVTPTSEPADAVMDIREFYDSVGWVEGDGLCGDTRGFVDTRPLARAHSDKCMRRLNKYFRRGGKYLLDVGSGAIPHDAMLAYDERFERRVCVDLSARGLKLAKQKLGDRGVCLLGDMTDLPLLDESVDAVVCMHVVYQVPIDRQAQALREMWRVLKRGGVAVVVYRWPYSPLEVRLARIARVLTGARPGPAAAPEDDAGPKICHEPAPLKWFAAQDWPFRYRIDAFRILSNEFMREHVADNWRGRLFLDALYLFQTAFPGFSGRHGALPTIVIHKD